MMRLFMGIIGKIALAFAFKGGEDAPLAGFFEGQFFVAIGGIAMPFVNLISDIISG